VLISVSARSGTHVYAAVSVNGRIDKKEWLNRVNMFDYDHAYRLVFEFMEAFYTSIVQNDEDGGFSPNLAWGLSYW